MLCLVSAGKEVLGAGSLGTVLMELSEGHVIITPAGPSHLLGMVADPSMVELGLLMSKADGLAAYLKDALRQVSTAV